MTTQYDVITKIKEMLPDVTNGIIKRSENILSSGALNLEAYEDNYVLPKIIMTACLHDIAEAYEPFNKADAKTVRNLRNF